MNSLIKQIIDAKYQMLALPLWSYKIYHPHNWEEAIVGDKKYIREHGLDPEDNKYKIYP